MTGPDRDYGDIVSRALHAALDPIEPADDGLAKIRQRTAAPWLKRQMWLLRTETSALGWLILVRCEPFFTWARSVLAATVAAASHGPRPGPAPSGAAGRRGWLGLTRGRHA
jgi:hypothetical protein